MNYFEEEITDTLWESLRFERTEYAEELGIITIPPLEESLSPEDINLLDDMVIELFDTLDRQEDLFNILCTLGLKIWRYRIDQNSNPIIDSFQPKRYTEKSYENKMQTFQKRIDDVLSLMGHRMTLKTQEASELMTALEKAYNSPQDYIGMAIMKEGNTKHPVKEYLKSLKIEGKSQVIKEFIKLLG